MNKSTLTIIIILLLTIPLASAFTTFNEEIQIHSDLSTTFIIEATTSSTDEIILSLPKESTIHTIQIDGVNVNCDTSEDADATIITCSTNLASHIVFVKSESSFPIIPSDLNYFFTLNQDIVSDIASIKITLPKNSQISEDRSITPTPSNQYLIGDSQILLWRFSNSETANISFLASNPKNTNYWPFVIIALVLALLMILVTKFANKKSKSNSSTKSTSHLDHLLENEKKVIEALNANDKEFLWQKELQLKSKLSKVQLSRTLRRMQERNIITKEPHGASNKISIVGPKKE